MKSLVANILARSGAARSDNNKTVLYVILFSFIIVILMLSFGMFSFVLLSVVYAVGTGWLYFAVFTLLSFMLCLFETIFVASTQVFKASDNEMLLSLPIRPGYILASRVLVMLTFEYFFSLITVLPAFVVWLVSGYADFWGILCFWIGFLLLPLLALTVALLLSWLLAIVTPRLRFKKALTLLLSVFFLTAYLYAYMNLQKYLAELLNRGEELAKAFRQALPPFYAYGTAVADGNILALFQLVLWTVIPFGLAMWLLATRFQQVMTTNRGETRVTFNKKPLQQTGVVVALTKKELSIFTSSTLVILNSSLGSMLMLIGAAVLVVRGSSVIDSIQNTLAVIQSEIPGTATAGLSLPVLVTGVLLFLATSNTFSYSQVSLEGKHLWITKSIPVSAWQILLSKIVSCLTVSSLPCLVASVLAAMVTAQNLPDWLLIICIPQTFLLLMAVSGLVVNLNLPKLDWLTEVQVVKQSLSVVIGIFGAMALVTGLGMLYAFVLSNSLRIDLYLWLCGVLFTMAATVCFIYLRKAGTAKLLQL